MASGRLIALTLSALALAACIHTTSPFARLGIHDFVSSEPIDSPQRTESVYEDPRREIVLFAVRNGPGQDCMSGCFYDVAIGLLAEGRIGWINPPYGTGAWTMFDVRSTDASLFDTAALSRAKERLRIPKEWYFTALADFVACDPDTPESVREQLRAAVGRQNPSYCFPPSVSSALRVAVEP